MGRPRKQEPTMMIATETGVVEIDGVPHNFTKDQTRVDPTSEIFRAVPQYFKPIEAHYPRVEQATAAPGEVRGDPED